MRRPRRTMAAVMAAALLAFAGITGSAAAFGGGGGWPPGGPPHPSGWVMPSAPAGSFQLRSFGPRPSMQHPAPSIDCSKVNPGTAAAAFDGDVAQIGLGGIFFTHQGWMDFQKDWQSRWAQFANQFCAVDSLQAALDRQITSRITILQRLEALAGKASGLTSGNLAAIDAELNNIITNLANLKSKVDAETTLAGLQADLNSLRASTHAFKDVKSWASLILGSESVLAAIPPLQTLAGQLATQVAAAPAGQETDQAKALLTAMNNALTDAQTLAAPLPAALLAITPSQLESGAADGTLWQSNQALFRAMWDVQKARYAYNAAEHELAEANASPKAAASA